MKTIASWLPNLLWLGCGLLLGLEGWSHFVDGLAVDSALPVPSYMIAGIKLPQSTYRAAAVALADADAANGDAAMARAEAEMNSAAPSGEQVALLESALRATPASSRGWLLLARARSAAHRGKAATALAQALILAPYDYWIAGARARVAARLWPELDADGQDRALAQTRLLWEEPLLRAQVHSVLTTREGAALVTRAFIGRRDELVNLNRWLAAQRRASAVPH